MLDDKDENLKFKDEFSKLYIAVRPIYTAFVQVCYIKGDFLFIMFFVTFNLQYRVYNTAVGLCSPYERTPTIAVSIPVEGAA